MSKHNVRDDFEMSAKLALLQDQFEQETAVRPSKGDILCMIVNRYMKEKGIVYHSKDSDDPDPYWD